MIARQAMYKPKQFNREQVEKIAEAVEKLYPTLPGFQSAQYLLDEKNGEFGSFTVWDSVESFEKSSKTIVQKVQAISSEDYESISVRSFELLEVKN